MAKNFSDPVISMRMRDVIERIVKGVLSRERPESFTGEVKQFNIFTRKALVKTAGMGDDDSLIEVNFPDNMHPNTTVGPESNIVRIEGKPGAYTITQILRGEWRLKHPRLLNPRFNGGAFDQIDTESWHFIGNGILPVAGNTVQLGSWSNDDFTLWSDGFARFEVIVTMTLFTSLRKRYVISLRQDDEGGGWLTCLPVENHGQTQANDFQLEVKLTGPKVELRIRRLRAGIFGTASYESYVKIQGEMFYYDSSTWELETSDPRPTEVFGRGTISKSEEVSGTVAQGPFNDSEHHSITVRPIGNLISPTSIKWNGQYIGWTGDFIVAGLGKGEISGSGFLKIPQPVTGTNYFLHGTTDIFGTRNTTVDGFDMLFESPGPNALYYEPLFFTANGVQPTDRFHLVGTSAAFKVPSHWILLAIESVASNNGNSLMLGNGQQHDHWKAITFTGTYTQYDAADNACQIRLIGSRAESRGLVKLVSGANFAAGASATIGVLSGIYVPPKVDHWDMTGTGVSTGLVRFILRGSNFATPGTLTLIPSVATPYISIDSSWSVS